MAKADAKKEAPDAEQKPKSKGKLILIIVIVLLVLVLVVGGGLVALLLMKKSGNGEQAAESPAATAAAPAATQIDLSRPPTFVSLDPFTVNLAPDEGHRYLQVNMALRVADQKTGDALKGFMPEIRHRINLLLSSKLPSEVATAEGRDQLASEITNETNRILGAPPGSAGPVQAVLFNSFIMQ